MQGLFTGARKLIYRHQQHWYMHNEKRFDVFILWKIVEL